MGYQKHNWITREIIRRQLLQNMEDGIYNEQERAIAAEVELGAALSTETSRAVEKENQLNASIVNVNNALTSEVSRATTKENNLQTSISNETTRATGVEGQLSTNISNVSSSLSTEVSRAMAAESTLQGNIDSEETRASAAEATLSSNIAAERTRAQNAESDLHDYVDQKVTGLYKPGGSFYFADLPSLDSSRLGYVYDIIDAFTTTADFREGAGKSYGPGTNVVIFDTGGGTLKYDVLPGFIDTSLFYNTGDSTEATIADGDYFPFYDVSATSKRKTLFSNFRSKLNIPGIATLSKAGIVKPDGTTVIVDENGVLSSVGGGQGSAEAAERMIAPIEPDASASTRAYTVGQKLILNEILYKAKTAIAIGDELVIGTNIELADNVSTQLDSKADSTKAFLIDATTENTLANDDTVPFYDTSASSKRKTTWSNIVAKIKASLSKSDVGLGNVPNVSTNDQTPTFSQASSRANIASGEKLSTIFGRIMKVIADLKAVAFSGSYNDLSNKPTIPSKTSQLTNDSGYIVSSTPVSYVNTPRVNTDYNSDLPGGNKTKIVEHGTESPNRPSDDWFYVITSQGGDATYATQLALGMTTGRNYVRTYQGGSWLAWNELGTIFKVSSLNANTVSHEGIWYVVGSITGAPSTSHGVLWYVKSIGTPFQLYFPDNSTVVYKRWYSNNAWSDWTDMNGTSVNHGWAGNNVSWDTMGDGYYGTNPNQLPTELQSLFSSYSYFSSYGTLHLNKGIGAVYPVIEYMDVFGHLARWNSNQSKWTYIYTSENRPPWSEITGKPSQFTPTSHASSGTEYGVGNASNYGHVKLSDTYNSNVGAAANGIGASQTALNNVYNIISPIGTIYGGNMSASVNVDNNRTTTAAIVNGLPAGTYLILAYAQFQDTSTNGSRKLQISISGGQTFDCAEVGGSTGYKGVSGMLIRQLSSGTQCNCEVTQTSGGPISVAASMTAIRIK